MSKPPSKPSWQGTVAMVQVEATAIRKKALTACRRSKTAFEKAEAELLRHEKEELPAHEAWMRLRHGSLLDEIRAMEEANRRLEWKIEQVLYACEELDLNGEEALAWVEEQERESEERRTQENFEERRQRVEEIFQEMLQELRRGMKGLKRKVKEQLRFGIPAEEIREQIKRIFSAGMDYPSEMLAGFFLREDVEALWREYGLLDEEEYEENEEEVVREEPRAARLKRLARELAFALHPDQCGEHDTKKLDLWHQVQEAVKLGDLDRLEVLHAHMQVLKGDTGPSLSVGRIQELTREFRESLNALRRRLRSLRNTPAWGFLGLSAEEKEAKATEVGKSLQKTRKALQRQARELEKRLKEAKEWSLEDEEDDWDEDDFLAYLLSMGE